MPPHGRELLHRTLYNFRLLLFLGRVTIFAILLISYMKHHICNFNYDFRYFSRRIVMNHRTITFPFFPADLYHCSKIQLIVMIYSGASWWSKTARYSFERVGKTYNLTTITVYWLFLHVRRASHCLKLSSTWQNISYPSQSMDPLDRRLVLLLAAANATMVWCAIAFIRVVTLKSAVKCYLR